MKELQELLVFVGRRTLELGMPAVHLSLGEPAALHDRDPLLLGNHPVPPEPRVAEEPENHPLMAAQPLDLGVDLHEAPLER